MRSAARSTPATDDDDGDQAFWREYLLYHRSEGFAFLVDSEDGWSWTAPITGVPERAGDGVKYQGVVYRKLYDYTGKATYVLGEFYWKLERDARTYNTDYVGTGAFSARRINRERTGSDDTQEITWSAGETLSADAVLEAFKLAPEKSAALQRDATPGSGNAASLLAKVFFWVFVVVVLLMMSAAMATAAIASRCAPPMANPRRSTRIACAARAAAADGPAAPGAAAPSAATSESTLNEEQS